MFLKLRVLFTVLAALCLAVIVPAGVFGDFLWFIILGGAALLFFGLMLLCKQAQEKAEHKDDPPAPDFLTPQDKEEK